MAANERTIMFFHHHQKSNKGKIFAAGIIGAALGVFAGMMMSPRGGKENRRALKSWSDQMKDEIKERTQNIQDMTKEKYDQLVDTVSQKYRNMQNIKNSEVEDLTADLKQRWERVKDEWKK
jgi:gas vesicle protein